MRGKANSAQMGKLYTLRSNLCSIYFTEGLQGWEQRSIQSLRKSNICVAYIYSANFNSVPSSQLFLPTLMVSLCFCCFFCLLFQFLDSVEVVSYRISSGDPQGRFYIDPRFGMIRTKEKLDHETQSVVMLTVQSQLGNSPVYSSTQVNISVIDVNDNPPVFLTKSDKVIISHTQPPGTAVYIAHADDKDSGLNGAIKYSLASNQSNAFNIDPSLGVVNLTRTVFEDKQQEYTLHIAAEDHGSPPLSSLLLLTVIIEEQKMGPTLVFQNLVYQVEVSEATPPGAQILQIQAHSLNPHGVTSKLTYSLESSTDSVAFGIRADTGWIYLRKYLNYEYAQLLSFRALVSTSEDENSMQNASTSVIVNVLDENDNSPVFMPESYFFKLEENPVPRGVVGTVTAVDKDSGRNGQLAYFLLSDGKYFKMNSNTGSVFMICNLPNIAFGKQPSLREWKQWKAFRNCHESWVGTRIF